jgi:hypothetical protein
LASFRQHSSSLLFCCFCDANDVSRSNGFRPKYDTIIHE